MPHYALSFAHGTSRFSSSPSGSPDILVEMKIDHGAIVLASFRYRNFTSQLGSKELAKINNVENYRGEGSTVLEVFEHYTRENHFDKAATEYLAWYMTYLLFIDFYRSEQFVSATGITTKLPVESFSSLLKRTVLPLMHFFCGTVRKVTSVPIIAVVVTTVQNFLNMFDLLFPEGTALDIFEMADYATSVILEISARAATTAISLRQELPPLEVSVTEKLKVPAPETPTNSYGSWLRQ